MSIGGHRVWPLVWRWVPGAKAIRFPWRLDIVNAGLAAVAVTIVLTWLSRRETSTRGTDAIRAAAAMSLGGLLIAEQVSKDDWAQLDRRAEAARLAKIPAPPPECRAFALVDEV